MHTVFITTSGLGTRLEGLTQYTNKALVPIGEKYAICRIIEKFPETTRFVVTLGYYGDHVRDFLELAYPARQFVFVNVAPFEGPGSSQAYSMLCAAPHLQTSFLYHCCDTILPASYTFPAESELTKSAPFTVFVSPHPDYTTYSGITVLKDNTFKFNRKREAVHDYAYIGVAYIADPELFWDTLRNAMEAEGGNASLGDTDAYRHLLASAATPPKPRYSIIPQFYDTGNLDSYRHACNAFPTGPTILAKPNESLCFFPDKVIKFLHSATANAKRIHRGELLEACGGPRILGHRPNFLAMTYEEGTLLAECREWGLVRKLLDWAQTHLWTNPRESEEYPNVCRRFYKTKTLERLAAYKAKHPEDCTTINNCRVGSMEDLLARVPWDDLCTRRFTGFHGDFILDNLLQRKDGSFVLLDWRECFDTETDVGDPAYDLAKLRHNLVFNHAKIAKGAYVIQKEGDQIFVDLECKYLLVRQLEELDVWIAEHREQGWSVRNIRILQAIIWLNMASLYDAPLSEFLYYFGKWNLSLAISNPH